MCLVLSLLSATALNVLFSIRIHIYFARAAHSDSSRMLSCWEAQLHCLACLGPGTWCEYRVTPCMNISKLEYNRKNIWIRTKGRYSLENSIPLRSITKIFHNLLYQFCLKYIFCKKYFQFVSPILPLKTGNISNLFYWFYEKNTEYNYSSILFIKLCKMQNSSLW